MTDCIIPEGYKETTLGIIPKEWEVKQLKSIVTPIKTFSFSRDKLSDSTQKLIYIHYGDIHKSGDKYNVHIGTDRLPYLIDGIISDDVMNESSFPNLQNGDILLPDASEDYDGVGHAWELLNVDQQKIIGGLHTIAMRPNPKFILLGYGSLMFYSWPVSKALKRIAQGTKVFSMSFNLIEKVKVILPTLKEQQKISEILNIWDKAIEKQTQLIDKLELRKKVLMQQLLTGKKRLPGFSGEWKKVKLIEIGTFFKGAGVPKDEIKSSGKYKCLTYGDIYTKYDIKIENVQYFIPQDIANISKQIQYGDICFAGSGETVKDIGKCAVFVDGDIGYAGGDIIIFRNKINANPIILSYILNSAYVNKQKSSLGQGHSVVHIYISNLERIKIRIPDIEEQNAMDEIFASCDKEIYLANQELKSLRQQKKGLMQILLTGKKRVL